MIQDLPFSSLSAVDVYAILSLRAEVFVVEQDCAYLDPDGRDTDESTRHLFVAGGTPGTVDAYLRLMVRAGECSIGRVVTAPGARGQGLAGLMVDYAIAHSDGPWVLHAQSQLQAWYEQRGFRRAGPDFDEDGIMHLPMRREI